MELAASFDEPTHVYPEAENVQTLPEPGDGL